MSWLIKVEEKNNLIIITSGIWHSFWFQYQGKIKFSISKVESLIFQKDREKIVYF
ncbi:MAG: hypothetical protein Kow0091_29520 [Geminocystis sp.]